MIKMIISGNLTQDPTLREVKYTNKSTGEIVTAKVANFTVAANDRYGEGRVTEYFQVSAWGGLGEACAQYLSKGRGVMVIGPIKEDKYVDQKGNIRTSMAIRASEVEFLGGAKIATRPEEVEEAGDEEDLPY